MPRYLCLLLIVISRLAVANTLNLSPCQWQVLGDGQSDSGLMHIDCGKHHFVQRRLDNNRPWHERYREFYNTVLLSALPISPSLHQASFSQGKLLLDFVPHNAVMLDTIKDALPQRLAQTLRTLHQGPDLPYTLSMRHDLNLWLSKLYTVMRGLPPAITHQYRILQPVYAWLEGGEQPCPSHNDLHHGNLLFSDDKIWIIDWETAAMADPMFDVATLANFFQLGHKATQEFLQHYLQVPPSLIDKEKLYLTQQASFFYFAVKNLHYAWFGKHPRLQLATSLNLQQQLDKLPPQSFEQMNQALLARSKQLDSALALQQYGLAMLQKVCSNVSHQHFTDALGLLGHGSQPA